MSSKVVAHPVAVLWDRLVRPIDHLHVVESMLGLPRSGVTLLAAALLTTSIETDELLEAMPKLSRNMAVSTRDVPIRTVGHVRGPILWAETVAARASAMGDEMVFVCRETSRAYDTPENRVLTHALRTLMRATRDVERNRATGQLNDIIRHVRTVADTTRRHLEHRTLADIPTKRPTPRDIQRTRSGHRRKAYAPALEFTDRASLPFVAEDIMAVCDQRSRRWLGLFDDTLAAAERRGVEVPHITADRRVLRAGEISFRHPAAVGDAPHLAGVALGELRLVPEGDETDGAGSTAGADLERTVISGRVDLERALDRLGV